MRHLLSIEDLDRAAIERICDRAASFAEVADREIKKVPALRGRTVLNLFYEASTRTRSSFELAAKRLSADVVNFVGQRVERREGRVAEGHRPDAQRPQARRDRHPRAVGGRRRARRAAGRRRRSSTPATASTSTPRRRCSTSTRCASAWAALDGLSIWIVGDVLHSRVARSNILAFQKMGAQVTVCGPPTLIPRGVEALGCDVRFTLDDLARGRRRLRPAHAARAHGPGLRADPARVRRRVPDQRPPAAPAPGAHAPGPGQPRRRALRRGRRLAPGGDHRPGRGRRGRPHGRPLRGHDGAPARAASTAPEPEKAPA